MGKEDVIKAASQMESRGKDFESFKIRALSFNHYIIGAILGKSVGWDDLLSDCKYLFYHGDGVMKGSNDDDTFEQSDLIEITINDI